MEPVSMDLKAKIAEEVKTHPVVLYMKGTPAFPQCGFSAAVVDIFNGLGVSFHAVDVLAEKGCREAIKQFTNWPTIPQVFVGGEFVGGCDITRELFAKGELKTLVDAAIAKQN